jgi:hypothetical protein
MGVPPQTMKIPPLKSLYIGGSSGIFKANHKRNKKIITELLIKEGVSPPPCSTPNKEFIGRVQMGDSGKFQRFGDYCLSQPGSPQRRAIRPGSATNIGIT